MIKIKKGLNVPISGAPEQVIHDGPKIRSVALLGRDYVGMKPTMLVQVGDVVKKGQALFKDKKTEGVVFTAPAAGKVAAVNRGHKRVLQSVVIDVEGDEEVEFKAYDAEALPNLSREDVVSQLVESGLWTTLRTRPFSKVPALDQKPTALFINAMDTNPLAADPTPIIKEAAREFQCGVQVLRRLTEGKVFVCRAPNGAVDLPAEIEQHEFAGPHPAGLVGTHIHYLHPVQPNQFVWHINYQDVIAVGRLFTEGRLSTERVVAVAGPQVEKPRLVRTVLGANTDELTAGQLKAGDNRVISGSVLSGATARGPHSYLGRYHLQVSVIREGRERNLLEYLSPGKDKHSVLGIYLSRFSSKTFDFTSSANGSARGMVPTSSYEKVMPLDILPTQLLRALIVGDVETAQNLGCLELDEEDLALCTYTCPCKYEYGPILRDNLTLIEKEG